MLETVELMPITFPDIERENLFGAGCSFAPEGGGLGALAIAQDGAGYLKIDGTVQRLDADVVSTQLPLGAREQYVGAEYSYQLMLEQDGGKQSGYESVNYPGRLTVRNNADQIVYDSEGVVQCGS